MPTVCFSRAIAISYRSFTHRCNGSIVGRRRQSGFSLNRRKTDLHLLCAATSDHVAFVNRQTKPISVALNATISFTLLPINSQAAVWSRNLKTSGTMPQKCFSRCHRLWRQTQARLILDLFSFSIPDFPSAMLTLCFTKPHLWSDLLEKR
jgi:hypothetical protein